MRAVVALPKSEYCTTKDLLMEQIKTAVSVLLVTHQQELEAVLRGDFATVKSAQGQLKIRTRTKMLLIERYRQHLSEHGC